MNNRLRDIPVSRAISTGFKLLSGFIFFGLSAAFISGFSTCKPHIVTLKFWETYPPLECRGDQGLIDSLLGAVTFGYKGGVGDHAVFAVLVGVAAVGLLFGGLLLAFRDADPRSVAEAAASDTVPVVDPPPSASYWPILGAFAAGTLVVGLVFNTATFVGAAIAVGVIGLMWTIKDWADHITADPSVNSAARQTIAFGLEAPVIAGGAVAVTAISISRVLLTLTKTGAWVFAGVLATVIFLLAIAVAYVPKLKTGVLAGLLLVGGIFVVGSGVVAALNGEREFEHHVGDHHDEGDHSDEGEHDDEMGEDDESEAEGTSEEVGH